MNLHSSPLLYAFYLQCLWNLINVFFSRSFFLFFASFFGTLFNTFFSLSPCILYVPCQWETISLNSEKSGILIGCSNRYAQTSLDAMRPRQEYNQKRNSNNKNCGSKRHEWRNEKTIRTWETLDVRQRQRNDIMINSLTFTHKLHSLLLSTSDTKRKGIYFN